jgi:hypothetical protein
LIFIRQVQWHKQYIRGGAVDFDFSRISHVTGGNLMGLSTWEPISRRVAPDQQRLIFAGGQLGALSNYNIFCVLSLPANRLTPSLFRVTTSRVCPSSHSTPL